MHYFQNTLAQPRIKDFFSHSLAADRLAHAYIFYGSEGRGKEAFALELAKALNCTSKSERPCNACPSCTKINHFSHPDIKFLFPKPAQMKQEEEAAIIKAKTENPFVPIQVSGHKTISIDSIRQLKNEAKYASFEAGKRVFIIYGAEYFSVEAANSFLKLLEEPPENLFIILIADEIRSMLDTIRSRCQPVYFPEFSDSMIESVLKKYGTVPENSTQLIRMSQRNIKKVYRLMYAGSEEWRNLVYQFVKSSAAGNPVSVNEAIETITRKRDKNLVLEILNLITLWFRDAIHYMYTQDSSDFVNIDFEDTIRKFADYYRHIEMEKVVDLVEQTMLEIKMNAHPALSLTHLSNQIFSVLSSKPSVREAV